MKIKHTYTWVVFLLYCYNRSCVINNVLLNETNDKTTINQLYLTALNICSFFIKIDEPWVIWSWRKKNEAQNEPIWLTTKYWSMLIPLLTIKSSHKQYYIQNVNNLWSVVAWLISLRVVRCTVMLIKSNSETKNHFVF